MYTLISMELVTPRTATPLNCWELSSLCCASWLLLEKEARRET